MTQSLTWADGYSERPSRALSADHIAVHQPAFRALTGSFEGHQAYENGIGNPAERHNPVIATFGLGRGTGAYDLKIVSLESVVDKGIARLNIDHFRKLLATKSDETKRRALQKLLAEEKAKLAAGDLPKKRRG